MREQLRKEIVKRTGGYVQSAEAAAVYEEESERITAHYDSLVKDGKTELEAYRTMLADIEVMKALLSSIPPDKAHAAREAEQEAARRQNRRLSQLGGSMQAALWLLTIPYYFLSSVITGAWHMTWLTFLTSAMGSVLIDMVIKYNKGISFRKMGGWHALLWLGITIAYFLTGFLIGGWAWALNWLLFPAGALIEVLWNLFRKLR